MTAENLSRDAFSYKAHLRALKALSELPETSRPIIWQSGLTRALATLADYEAREGKVPDAEMTFGQIEKAVKDGGLAALFAPTQPGLLGSILANAVNSAKL